MSTAISLEELLSYDPRPKNRLDEQRFLCLFCGDNKPRDDAHRSLSVNKKTGAWICHRCQEKGLIKEKWTERPIGIKSLKGRAKAAIAKAFSLPPKHEPAKSESPTKPMMREKWAASIPLAGTQGATYLEGRSIPVSLADDAGVRYVSDWFRRPAVLFPIYDRQGELVSVSGRFVDGRDDPKTQTAGPKSLGVFSTPDALSRSLLAVVEAPIDALSLWAYGVPSIALIGTTGPEWLPSALAFKKVLVATDDDEAGDNAAEKLEAELSSRGAHTFRFRPEVAKDWSELLATDEDLMMAKTLPYSDKVNDEWRASYSLKLLEIRRTDEAIFVASLIEDINEREHCLRRLRQG